MKHTVIYIHGQGGCAEEAEHYRPLFPEADVIGFDYRASTPWEAAEEFPAFVDSICKAQQEITLVANSIGAFFAMSSLSGKPITRAFFISPIVDMERLIRDMMGWANVSEDLLQSRGKIETDFGQTLDWEYLTYVREHPLSWRVPTHILYAEGDTLTARSTVTAFAGKIGASLTVMPGGEHWFHTEEEMRFLDGWILSHSRRPGL